MSSRFSLAIPADPAIPLPNLSFFRGCVQYLYLSFSLSDA